MVPTVGRVVWYYHDKDQIEPMAATVASINNKAGEILNLSVSLPDGRTCPETNVPLVKDRITARCCIWPEGSESDGVRVMMYLRQSRPPSA